MAELETSAELFSEKRNKALAKLNSFSERFEKIKRNKTADLNEAGKIVEEMNETNNWWQTIP
jgi:hypothetical protein